MKKVDKLISILMDRSCENCSNREILISRNCTKKHAKIKNLSSCCEFWAQESIERQKMKEKYQRILETRKNKHI